MKIKEYQVLVASGVKEINELVKKHLTDGWSLQGGISCVVTNLNFTNYMQAVVRLEE